MTEPYVITLTYEELDPQTTSYEHEMIRAARERSISYVDRLLPAFVLSDNQNSYTFSL